VLQSFPDLVGVRHVVAEAVVVAGWALDEREGFRFCEVGGLAAALVPVDVGADDLADE
jgi:hypothetical protein